MWYMYHMVHFGMRTSQARERLLAAEQQQRAALLESGTSPRDARHFWERLSDLLATGDRAAVTEAYERFLQRAPTTDPPPRSVADAGVLLLVLRRRSGA